MSGDWTDVTVPVKLSLEVYDRFKERADQAGLTPEALAEKLLRGAPVAGELCCVVFEGAPQVFSGKALDEALIEACRLAEKNEGAASVMLVPRAAVEKGLARRYVGVVPLTLGELIEREAGEQR